MRLLIQKCSSASVTINALDYFEEIGYGLVVFVAFKESDNIENIKYMAKKMANLRIFEDNNGVMNRSVLEEHGSVLSVSQFTLYADTSKGNRPFYGNAMKSDGANALYELWNEEIRKYLPVKTGVFGADMTININNIGPTTILLET